jgi:hypothetical protein
MQIRILTLLTVFTLTAPAAAQAGELSVVLDQVVEIYGGEDNLRKLDRMVQEWDVVALMGNRHGTDKRIVRVPDQLRVELTYPGKKEVRILNENAAFTIFGEGPAPQAAPLQRDAMRLQLMRHYSPLVLRNKLRSLKLTDSGNSLVLTLTEHGVRVEYFLTKESWRIERVVGTLKVGSGQMSFITDYSDFKRINGVLVHQREDKYAGSTNTAMLQLRHIEFEAEFDDKLLSPPAEKDATDPLIAAGRIRMIAARVLPG